MRMPFTSAYSSLSSGDFVSAILDPRCPWVAAAIRRHSTDADAADKRDFVLIIHPRLSPACHFLRDCGCRDSWGGPSYMASHLWHLCSVFPGAAFSSASSSAVYHCLTCPLQFCPFASLTVQTVCPANSGRYCLRFSPVGG